MRALARDIERELAELNEEFIRLLDDHEKALEKCRRLERENSELLLELMLEEARENSLAND